MRKKLVEEGFQICIKSSSNFRQSRKPDRTPLFPKLERQCKFKVKLNKMTHFDQNNIIFYLNSKKRNLMTCLLVTIHLLHHFFFHLKASWVAIFSKHLMLHLSTKPNKLYTTIMAWQLTIPRYGFLWPIDTTAASAPP